MHSSDNVKNSKLWEIRERGEGLSRERESGSGGREVVKSLDIQNER